MFSLSALILALFTLSTPALADNYYSSDLYQAINEARQHTHHYDYSNALRYERSTSQSIQIPRLLLNEMEQMVIKTPELAEIEGQGAETSVDSNALPSFNNDSPQAIGLSSPNNALSNGQQGVGVRVYINQ